jgi:hypothetical protein
MLRIICDASVQGFTRWFVRQFGGAADDDASSTHSAPSPPPSQSQEKRVSNASDGIDDNQRMPPTIHDYIDHVISRWVQDCEKKTLTPSGIRLILNVSVGHACGGCMHVFCFLSPGLWIAN